MVESPFHARQLLQVVQDISVVLLGVDGICNEVWKTYDLVKIGIVFVLKIINILYGESFYFI